MHNAARRRRKRQRKQGAHGARQSRQQLRKLAPSAQTRATLRSAACLPACLPAKATGLAPQQAQPSRVELGAVQFSSAQFTLGQPSPGGEAGRLAGSWRSLEGRECRRRFIAPTSQCRSARASQWLMRAELVQGFGPGRDIEHAQLYATLTRRSGTLLLSICLRVANCAPLPNYLQASVSRSLARSLALSSSARPSWAIKMLERLRRKL